ncbi:MAG: bifunctional 5,10-methylenetetrahydrofolate dehydrogenase/5,10-methenyltetrahydrofolate cyclohydrolase [Candidatus Sungbacteria bacterium]|uniref:Bifunctional protein FolD n=1 Tax=Candidatus Sungiibacteriota bacterium TaxID=2750080 RepID=A0A9D6QYU0_9BACT|nr:bifunctional 5,10-methylenetetrahydrofolate dehydrogenase/5,10-methenyltetrahydrofolate cyclohydrolase [Candidatus Sungbacteria bacterium]
MNLIDGKALAEKIGEEVKTRVAGHNLSLGIISIGQDLVSQKFIEQKKKKGQELGIEVRTYQIPEGTSKHVRRAITDLIKKTDRDGYIIQLPLPEGLNTQYILNSIPEMKDVDCLNQKNVGAFAVGRSPILPPVIAAIDTILKSRQIELEGKEIAVVGAGRLVGRPIIHWLTNSDLPFSVYTYHSSEQALNLKDADIIFTGTGRPNLIHAEMVKDGTILFDCGISIEEGNLSGDVDRKSMEGKDGWLTPVPGGIGPLTVMHVFKNLTILKGLQ